MSGDNSSGRPLVELRHLVAGYLPGVDILKQVDLTLYPGEMIGIIGPNGAGKSTLLKALFGLLDVRSGEVIYKGESIKGLRAYELVAKGVGYLQPNKTAERLEGGVGFFPRLGERLGQRAGLLSGGERQMLAMGRALMMNPQVLLLDEPSAGLSPVLQDQVFARTRDINRSGVAVIMVEQNARRCLQICHRGYVLDHGRNAYTGTGQSLLSDPKVIELYLGTLARGG